MPVIIITIAVVVAIILGILVANVKVVQQLSLIHI